MRKRVSWADQQHRGDKNTHRPKSLTFSQSVATSVRLRRENSVLRYALRQKRYVATPPLANCPQKTTSQHLLIKNGKGEKRRTLPFMKGRSAIALSEPMYASEPWCE